MSTVSLHAHDRAVKVDPGPELRALGMKLGYPFCNLADAATHHARHGTVEGCEVVDPADVQALDVAADDDAMARYADECGPESWGPWVDRDVWEPTEATEVAFEDQEWWHHETREAVASCV